MANQRLKLVKSEDIKVTELFEQFQNFNKAKNLSQATIRYYNQYYEQLIKFAGEGFKASDFNEQFIFDFVNHLRDQNENSDISINSSLRALAGMDAFRLQRILGHSNISMTMEYVNLFGQDLAKVTSIFTVLSILVVYCTSLPYFLLLIIYWDIFLDPYCNCGYNILQAYL